MFVVTGLYRINNHVTFLQIWIFCFIQNYKLNIHILCRWIGLLAGGGTTASWGIECRVPGSEISKKRGRKKKIWIQVESSTGNRSMRKRQRWKYAYRWKHGSNLLVNTNLVIKYHLLSSNLYDSCAQDYSSLENQRLSLEKSHGQPLPLQKACSKSCGSSSALRGKRIRLRPHTRADPQAPLGSAEPT